MNDKSFINIGYLLITNFNGIHFDSHETTQVLEFKITVVSLKQASAPLNTRIVYEVGMVGLAIPNKLPEPVDNPNAVA